MDRKATARETLDIMERGYYEISGKRIDISERQSYSVKNSFLLTPEQGEELLTAFHNRYKEQVQSESEAVTWDCSAVEALLRLSAEGKKAAVLNFASAKNPGGGFINGAMAQEESLAASSCLYRTLLAHEEYYINNRLCKSMMYTDHAIYSPEVVFFRDGRFHLLENPVTASVLTLPAVNMGQVVRKREDKGLAERVMKRRMELALAIFAEQGCKHLVLGAYGCGVFQNDPNQIAAWWKELLCKAFAGVFETVVFAVLDRSADRECIRAFERAGFPVY